MYASRDFGQTWISLSKAPPSKDWVGVAMSADGTQLVATARGEWCYLDNERLWSNMDRDYERYGLGARLHPLLMGLAWQPLQMTEKF